MLSLTGWYGLAKENIAPFNTRKWRLSDSVGQKDSAILKNGFFLGDTPQAAVVKSYIISCARRDMGRNSLLRKES